MPRFVVVDRKRALKADNAESDFWLYEDEEDEYYDRIRSYVLDTKTNRLLGADGGEPEDQSLDRDWRWVVDALNTLDKEK